MSARQLTVMRNHICLNLILIFIQGSVSMLDSSGDIFLNISCDSECSCSKMHLKLNLLKQKTNDRINIYGSANGMLQEPKHLFVPVSAPAFFNYFHRLDLVDSLIFNFINSTSSGWIKSSSTQLNINYLL